MTSFSLELPKDSGPTRLRSLRLDDLQRFTEYRADPVLAEYQSWEPMNREVAAAFLHEAVNATHLIPGNWIQLALAESGSDLLIGDVGLYLSDDGSFAELGFTLAREHQGKGHATRAAELAVQLALRHPTLAEVRAVTDELNKASVAVLMRAGFRHTGSHEAVFKEKPCVELHFTRTRNKTQTPRSS
ncbi:MAG: GNAT family N-acetyltransferase [Fimbriimonadaceae bacterium]|nr:GNAT family N-acetyltransferase [Fimbriimonadaceae bacterium]